MTMLDLILRGATLSDGRVGLDIGVKDGRIAALAPALPAQAYREIDVGGYLVSPPFRIIAQAPEAEATLDLPGRATTTIDWRL